MNIKNGWFVSSMGIAQQYIKEKTEKKVAQIPILLDSPNKRYYITDSGDVFFCKVIANKCFIIPKHHDKRKLSEKFVRLSIGAKKEIHVTVAQCMYNAFKAHRWLDLRPKYKNGNNDDYTLSNLYIPNEKNVIIDISVMNSCTSLYKSSFKRICSYLSFSYGLSMQDSEDIVQDAFIFVTCNRSNSDILATWVWYCKKRAVDYINHIKKFSELKFDIYFQNNEFEFPIFSLLKVKKDRDIMAMRCNGYSNVEIAKLLNISKGNVDARVSRSIALVRNVLKRDIEYYEKRRSI